MSSRNKNWETAVSSSPIAHRFVKRPLSNLRRKTENLLSDITGANVKDDEQVLDKERGKRLTCRACNVRFHDEVALGTKLDTIDRACQIDRSNTKLRMSLDSVSDLLADVFPQSRISQPFLYIQHLDMFPSHLEGHDVRRSPTRKMSQASISTSNEAASPTFPSRDRTRSNTSSSFSSPHQRERSDSSGRILSTSPGFGAFASPTSSPNGLNSRKPSFLDLDMVASQQHNQDGPLKNSNTSTAASTRELRNMQAGAASAALAAKNREALKLKEETKSSLRQKPTRSGSEGAVEVLSEIKSQFPSSIFPGLASPTSNKKWKRFQDDGVGKEGSEGGEAVGGSTFGSGASTLRQSKASRPPIPPRASTTRNLLVDNNPRMVSSTRKQPSPPAPRAPRRSTNPFISSKTDPSGSFSGGSFDVDLSAMSLNDQRGVEHSIEDQIPPLPPISTTSPNSISSSSSNPFSKFMIHSSPTQDSSLPYLGSGTSDIEESESLPFETNILKDQTTSNRKVEFSKPTSKPSAYCPNCSKGFENARQVINHLDDTRCGEEDDDEGL